MMMMQYTEMNKKNAYNNLHHNKCTKDINKHTTTFFTTTKCDTIKNIKKGYTIDLLRLLKEKDKPGRGLEEGSTGLMPLNPKPTVLSAFNNPKLPTVV